MSQSKQDLRIVSKNHGQLLYKAHNKDKLSVGLPKGLVKWEAFHTFLNATSLESNV